MDGEREATTRRGPGRPRRDLGPERRAEILALLRAGAGRRDACSELQIGYDRFLRALREEPGFADEVAGVEQSRCERCESFLLQVVGSEAHGVGHRIRSAIAYLARRDRAEAAASRRPRRGEARDDGGGDELPPPYTGLTWDGPGSAFDSPEFVAKLCALGFRSGEPAPVPPGPPSPPPGPPDPAPPPPPAEGRARRRSRRPDPAKAKPARARRPRPAGASPSRRGGISGPAGGRESRGAGGAPVRDLPD